MSRVAACYNSLSSPGVRLLTRPDLSLAFADHLISRPCLTVPDTRRPNSRIVCCACSARWCGNTSSTGEPVSSQWLARHAGCAGRRPRSATSWPGSRNRASPAAAHVRGRVPTDLGYRQGDVDVLMQGRAGRRVRPRTSRPVSARAARCPRCSRTPRTSWPVRRSTSASPGPGRAPAAADRVRPARRRPRAGRGGGDEARSRTRSSLRGPGLARAADRSRQLPDRRATAPCR